MTTFMDLEVPEYSYMFGFLQADGHLAGSPTSKGRLALEVKAVDRPLLERFKDLCPYPSSIRERHRSTNFIENHRSAVWTMCAAEGRARLNELGLPYGKKSTNIAPPRAPHTARDYVRGLVDADGSLGLTAKCLPFISLTTSSDAIAEYFSTYGTAVTCVRPEIRKGIRATTSTT